MPTSPGISMAEAIGNCSNCEGERAKLCNSFFYEAATGLFDSAGAVESLISLGDNATADAFHEDIGAEVLPKLVRRLDVIGCALNPVEIQVKVQERMDREYEGYDR